MKKKILSVLLTTAMVASMLVGCGSSQGQQKVRVQAQIRRRQHRQRMHRQRIHHLRPLMRQQTQQPAAEKLVWQCLPRIFRDGIRMAPIWKLS